MKKLFFLISTILSIAASSQTVIGRQNVDRFARTSLGVAGSSGVTAADSTYALTWLPSTYPNTTRTYPLIVFLHGAGDGGTGISGLNNLLNAGLLTRKISDGWNATAVTPQTGIRDSFIVVSPQQNGWSYLYPNLKYIIPEIFKKYRVDLNRVYLTGLSAGGDGTWGCAGSLDSVFIRKITAIAPISGADITGVNGYSDEQTKSNLQFLTKNYGVALWTIIGENDPGLRTNTNMHDTVMKRSPVSPAAKLTVITGLAHSSAVWGKAYDTIYRPYQGNYYGSNASNAYTLSPNTNGASVMGSGVTKDSLDLWEWFLYWNRSAAIVQNFTVSAGPDVNLTLPTNFTTLVGSAFPGSGHTIASYLWSKVQGPSNYFIATPNQSTTQITGLSIGVYYFVLTVTDNSGSSISDVVFVTVSQAQANNQPPTTTVPSPATIILPTSSLSVLAHPLDPENNFMYFKWTKLSAPSQPVFKLGFIGSSTTQGAQASPISNSFAYIVQYYFRGLGIIDTAYNLGKGSTNIYQGVGWSYVGPGPNTRAPIDTINVRAVLSKGANVVIVNYPNNNYDILTVHEVLAAMRFIRDTCNSVGVPCYISGTQPRQVGFSNADRLKLIEINDSCRIQFGKYFLDFYSAVTQPNSIYVRSDYGDGDSLHLNNAGHRQLANIVIAANPFEDLVQSTTNITSPTLANTPITGFATGLHRFMFSCFDQYGLAAWGVDTVNVSGTTVNQAPFSIAGADQTIQLPVSSVNLNGSGSHDPDGTIASYGWSKMQGGSCTITSPTSAVTSVTGLSAGVYQFRLTVVDNSGYANIDDIKITVLAASGCHGTRRILTQIGDHLSIDGSTTLVSPGDTLVVPFTGTIWAYLFMQNISGAPNCYVNVINDAGNKVRFINGIQMINCKYMKISGSGNSSIQYGFEMRDTAIDFDGAPTAGDAISITGKSRNIEVERCFITHKRYGFLIQNRPNCDTSINNYVMDSISIHDNWVRYVGSEAVYAWFTDPDNHSSPVTCDSLGFSHDFYYKPSRGGDLQIYNNIIDSTGRGGIQVSNCSVGSNEIFNNTISNVGMQLNVEQGNGISLGGFTRAYVHDNNINHTLTDGIISLGTGQIRIENNIINHPGNLFGTLNATVQSIFVHTYNAFKTSPVDSTYWTIKNNQCDSTSGTPSRQIYVSDGYGIHGYNNFICNNTKLISGRPAVIDAANSAADPPFNVPIHYYTSGCTVVVNQSPIAGAGADQQITLPVNSLTVTGSGSDIDGAVVSYAWAKISGPATFTIANPNNFQTDLTGLIQGTYQFKLTVTDNLGATGVDTMQVIVNPAINILPIANAGTDQVVSLPTTSVSLTSAGSSDPDGSITAYLWSYVSGPATFNFVTPTASTTTVNTLGAGTYVFNLKVTDNSGAVANDQVQIIVNQPPTANAGANQAITLPTSSVTLNGTLSSDADGTITTYSWVKTSGGAGTITSPASATTTVTGMVASTYVFTLTVTDNRGATSSNACTVVVNAAPPANIPPIANAGPDKNITLPTVQVTVVGSGSDADGSVVSYLWEYFSGPTTFTISSPTSSTTVIKDFDGSSPGTYIFKLTVTDNLGATGIDFVTVQVNSAPAVNVTRLIFYHKRAYKFHSL